MRFTTKVTLVILRLVIGWHFLFEGVHKIHTWHVGESESNKPFSSEAYFRESSGPLGPEMRGKIPNTDQDLLDRLDPKKDIVVKEWDVYPEQLNNLYDLDEKQKKKIKELVDAKKVQFAFWVTADRAKLAFPKVPNPGFLNVIAHETLTHGGTVPAYKVYKRPFGSEKFDEPMTTAERVAYYQGLLDEYRKLSRPDKEKDDQKSRAQAVLRPVDKDQQARLRADITAIRTDLLADLDKFTTSLKDEMAEEVRRPLKGITFYADMQMGLGPGDHRKQTLALVNSANPGALDPIFKKFDDYHEKFATIYKLDADQKTKAQKLVDQAKEDMRKWLMSDGLKQQVAHYQATKADIPQKDKEYPTNALVYLASQLAPYASGQEFLVLINKQTVGPVNAFLVPINSTTGMVENPHTLHEDAYKALAAGYEAHTNKVPTLLALVLDTPKTKAYPPEPAKVNREIDRIDLVTMWTLTVVGALLLIGLLTRPAGLIAMAFLVLTYLTYPPFPWLPIPPNTEGNPLFVNKNVIEFVALLVLLTVPSGRWFGVDALIYRVLFGAAPPQQNANRATPDGVNGHRLLSESLRLHSNR